MGTELGDEALCNSEEWGGNRNEGGNGTKRRGDEGGVVALGHAWDQACVWHTSPPVDPSENVTLMNLKPRTGYNVRVQLSRPGEGGEGAWGPSTLMTTDCPGEEPRYILPCSLRVSCHCPLRIQLGPPPKTPAFPSGVCPSLAQWELMAHLVPSTH